MGRSKTFAAPDGDFHYLDWGGSGTLAHISHATGFCAGAYTPLAERLLQSLRVVGMDDRGHGRSTVAADPRKLHNWGIFAKDLQRFLEYLNEPVIAIGHSRGAVSSMMVAIERPELVRALVLIDPITLPPHWNWLLFLAKKTRLSGLIPIAYRAARRKKTWPDREHILAAYRDRYPFKTWKDGFLEAYVEYGMEATGQGTVRLCCHPAWEHRCFAVCPHDVWRRVPRVQQPVLVLYGDQSDVFVPSAEKRFKAVLPHADFRCFAETSHFVPMERPDETAEAILRFIEDKQVI